MEVDYRGFFKDFDNIVSSEYGILIADSDRNLLYSYNNFDKSSLVINESDIMNNKNKNMKFNGVDFSIIKHQLSQTNWTIYFYIPSESIYIDAKSIAVATILMILVCFLLLLFITWVFSRTIVQRIENLNNKVKLVEQNNLDIQIYSSSTDEIGELTNNFGRMLKTINNLIVEIFESKLTQKDAEMKALQAQINPHFLYNTLSLINWEAIKIDSTKISHLTNTLSKFYRTMLNRGKDIISVRDEIENTKAYIEIQSIMHDYKFSINYDFHDEVFSYNMINFVLQPIVENAVMHGIDNKRSGRGALSISGYFIDDTINLIVEDNGEGMSEDTIQKIYTHSKGYGIENVQNRLKRFYGDSYGIFIDSRIGIGTKITVKIPGI